MTNTLLETLPHRRMEAWKWTDIRGTLDAKNGVTNRNGLSNAATPEFHVPEGLSVTRTPNINSDGVMAKLAGRFAGDTYSINVPDDYASRDSLSIDFQSPGHARIIIKVGKGAQLTLEEVYCSGGNGMSNIDINIDLAEGAQLSRKIFTHDDDDFVRVVTAHISLWAQAELAQFGLSFGGGLTRLETRIAALGRDVKADIHGAYLLKDKRHCDMTSYIDLGAENAVIRQSVKGVLCDKSRGVFQGKFHVRRPAQYTDAEMRHDAIMLSDSAQVRAKPELEIYADDVACAHGNTVGALDETALFYMRQRGIPLAQARALLTEAFVAQAFTDMTDSEGFMTEITTWLEQNS